MRLCYRKRRGFDTVYTFVTDQEDYRNAVQRLALQYSQYIRWKMEDDDAALAEEMTGYPAEQDAFHLENLEEQKKVWFSGIGKETFTALQNGFAESGQPVELALELDRPEWYTAYLSMESAVFLMLIFGKPDSRSADFSPRPALYRKCFLPASGTNGRETVRTDG